MMIFIILLLVLIGIYLLITVPYLTADITYDNKVLKVELSFWFLKKVIKKDFSDTTAEKVENTESKIKESLNNNPNNNEKYDYKSDDTKKTETKQGDTEGNGIKDTFQKIKARVFKPETGFDSNEAKKVLSETKESFSYYWGLIRRFLRAMRYKIYIPTCRITIDYGTEDAALTGMLYGFAWGAIGFIYPFVARYAYAVYPILNITPDFYGKRFDLKVKSIIKVRPVHIINGIIPPLLTFVWDYLKEDRTSKKEDK